MSRKSERFVWKDQAVNTILFFFNFGKKGSYFDDSQTMEKNTSIHSLPKEHNHTKLIKSAEPYIAFQKKTIIHSLSREYNHT